MSTPTRPTTDSAENQELPPITINDWHIDSTLSSNNHQHRYAVHHNNEQTRGFLILYPIGHETDTAIYKILANTHRDHIPILLETGHWQQRFYEVHEWINGPDLSQHNYFSDVYMDIIVEELATALHDLGAMGIRHRNINPRAILIRRQQPLDLVITDFSSARLSDFDVETVAPLALSRYSAPETIVGAVNVASDWWGMGIVLLEQLTRGACFAQFNDKAFMMHVVTRPIDLPDNIEPHLQHLLAGLLVRDPLQRWQWEEVQLWLAGTPPPAPQRLSEEQRAAHSIQLNQQQIHSPEQFALLAAQHEHWQAGKELFQRGHLATWCEQNLADKTIAAQLRQLGDEYALENNNDTATKTNTEINEDFKYSLALMIVNPSIPLTYHGDIITPAWLLPNAALAYRLLNSRVIDYLRHMQRERWLISLKYRVDAIRQRGKLLDITLDEKVFQPLVLSTSRANLDAEYVLLRNVYADATHAGLIDLLDKKRLNDEDLILLLSAKKTAFIALEAVLQQAIDLAQHHIILVFDAAIARQQLVQLRAELYQQLSQLSADFSRCGHPILDGWLDEFRLEGRLQVARILVLLSMPAEQWQKPAKQRYLNNLFNFFEKRVINNILRGSLVRLTISKNTAKIDLTELDTGLRSASSLVEHILDRGNTSLDIDPTAYSENYLLSRRLANTVHQARVYRQETGIDSLYVGFPFLLRQEAHKTTRPRVAPLFLWPVAVDYDSNVYKIRFAKEREEVRLNPALEGILPNEQFEKLKQLRKALLRRGTITIQTVLDNVGSLYPLRERTLVSHPKIDLRLAAGESFIEASAVLFNATFVGQAISEDLRRLRQLPIQQTALAAAFQLPNEEEITTDQTTQDTTPEQKITEYDKYFITPADPSQEKAILHSRTAPGLLIEGPPGTGKSQTIVNIISDCVGRKENILVICQKQAALQVVAKRLEAGGLQNRFFMVNDINRDRSSTIRTLREQLATLKKTDASKEQWTESQRQAVANKIDRLEERLNTYHQSLYHIDPIAERSFRHMMSELILLEAQHKNQFIDVPALRSLLDSVTPDTLNTLQEDIEPLAYNWLLSEYETSPLHCLKRFAADTALVNTIQQSVSRWVTAERQRQQVINSASADFDDGEHLAYQQWVTQYGHLFHTLNTVEREQIAAWFDLFYDEVNSYSSGVDILHEVEALSPSLSEQNPRFYHQQLSPLMQESDTEQIQYWQQACLFFLRPRGWLGALNPAAFWHKSRLNALQNLLALRPLTAIGKAATLDDEDYLRTIEQACHLELACRPIRQRMIAISDQLNYPHQLATLPFKRLRQYVKKLLDILQNNHAISQAVLQCPRKRDAQYFLRKGTQHAYEGFFAKLTDAINRADVRQKSLHHLQPLAPWFKAEWMQQADDYISHNRHQFSDVEAILTAIPNAKAYQHFRLDTQHQTDLLFQLLAYFRHEEKQLQQYPAKQIGSILRHSLRREALLAWKNRLEREQPALLINKQDVASKIRELASTHESARHATQQVLQHNINKQHLANDKQWEAITRLRGVRYKRLREFIDEGIELGLMEIRPVWLMNPEVASQALPLKANLFDVVIYDEASQLLVDYAVPTLYRAKRAIISGDEKQMPPTSFFASKVDSDEDPMLLELDDDLSASEKIQQEEAWNRHEIKDQSDLLSLGRSFLPSTTLQIHYRSRYESLIKFSNHAFYNGQLNVPRKHPLTEIKRAQPLEVIRVDGEYSQQTNPDEAVQVVKTLTDYWQKPASKRPSIGVVTFNKKQAELIEEHIQRYANEDDEFNRAYLAESQRTENGEAMGFFVKNVENVQGDERDIMLFSTTFGRDASGAFYRRFGALGQKNGERRLNVAITRAKEKVILVTSMPIHKISDALATGNPPDKPRDYLQLYLDFASKMSAGEVDNAFLSAQKLSTRKKSTHERQVQDGFVASVAAYLAVKGYPTTATSSNDDSFQLDLAIEDPKTGLFVLGIECDSPQHSLLAPASARELWRPSILKQSVGQIHRINSRDWYHHREREEADLLAMVERVLFPH